MSLTFYYAPMSTASITQLVMAELDVPCESVKVDLKSGDTKKPEFLKLNPNGKVPLIVHDGTPVWESSAITMYLGEAFGTAKKLYPAPGPQRGAAMSWIAWSNVTVGEAVGRYARGMGFFGDEANERGAAKGKVDVENCLRILDNALAGKQFLLGEYSLVDTHLHAMADWLKHMKFDLDGFANLRAWAQRCAARPAYAKVMGNAPV